MRGRLSLKGIANIPLKSFPLRLLLIVGLILLVVIVLTSSDPLFADSPMESKRVLLLHSYHHGNKWTDDETEGVRLALGFNRPGLQLSIEYMDTKRLASPGYFSQLAEIYANKYGHSRFDVIIAADDNAFFFLREHRDHLFPETPVVFCGVNYFEESYLDGVQDFTGVNEEADLKGAIDIALKLHPGTERVVLITDATETGRRISTRFKEIIPLYKKKVVFQILADLDMETIQKAVGRLEEGSLVLFTFFFKDRKGEFFEYYESTRMITDRSQVPVYGVWDYSLDYGIVGGLLASGVDQGKVAGEIVKRILKGEDIGKIPVVQKSPNRFYFDYRQLARFGIKSKNLPPGSTVLGAPTRFYEINKGMAWTVIVGSFALGLLVIFLLVNIIKRKNAERAFLASEKNFHSLVDNLRVGVFRSSKEILRGHFLQVNRAMLSIFGYDTLEELQSFPIASLYQRPKDREVIISDVIEKGYVKDRELAMQKKDGTPISVSCSVAVHYNEKGAIQWFDGVMEDVTQRKNLEEQFRHAQKMEAVGTLAGGVAHDFNNLLTAVMGYAELGGAMTEKEDLRSNYFKHILSCSRKAAALTRSLLAFSRKQIMKPKLSDLNFTIQHIEPLLKRLLSEEIEVRISYSKNSLNIFADPNQMEQVLMNLATNASDAMPNGGKLSISTQLFVLSESNAIDKDSNLQPGSYAMVTVSDTGQGINKSIRHKVFEPFFTTKEIGKGTGLGLSTVYGIIKQHNGEIEVSSQHDTGTTFKIFIPIHEGRPEIAESHLLPSLIIGGDETILLAEDNQDVQDFMIQTLNKVGYKVIVANNGVEALELFGKHQPEIDLVLTDMMMPKKNGKEVAAEISHLDPEVKVLFMSGNTSSERPNNANIEDGVIFLSKPMSPALLLFTIRNLLDK